MDKVCTGRCKKVKDVENGFHKTSRKYYSKKKKKMIKYVYSHSKCKDCRNTDKKEKNEKKKLALLNY